MTRQDRAEQADVSVSAAWYAWGKRQRAARGVTWSAAFNAALDRADGKRFTGNGVNFNSPGLLSPDPAQGAGVAQIAVQRVSRKARGAL